MKYPLISSLVLGLLAFTLVSASCKTQKPPQTPEPPAVEVEQPNALDALAKRFENGEISKCKHQGNLVYVCGLNANDAGTEIFNEKGEKIATCNYGWGRPDQMCKEVTECKVIYRVAKNIWGKPAVDLINN